MNAKSSAASAALAVGLLLVAAGCRSSGSSTEAETSGTSMATTAPSDGGRDTTIAGVHDTPNVVGTVTYASFGGVMVDITVDNTPPPGWEIDSVRAWVGEGSTAPDQARGNPPIASPELPFSGTPVPPSWSGGSYFEDLSSPVWLLVEVTLRDGASSKKHLHKASYSTSSGLVSIPFSKTLP